MPTLTKAKALLKMAQAGAKLPGADLTGANLVWTNLVWADLSGADLSAADLLGANLDNVIGADFTGALNVPAKYLKD